MSGPATLEERRARYAAAVADACDVTNPRVRHAFATVPREAFLPLPPWTLFAPGGWSRQSTSDPADLYDDVLVVLDRDRGVNNGQPSLHAAWLAAVDPRPGDTAVHVGAGTGYYTAMLAALVAPEGRVEAYEIDGALAEMARVALSGLPHVMVRAASAIGAELPEADVIYVNAGLAAPDPVWLTALKPGGRLIFPWQPFGRGGGGVTLLVTRAAGGFRARSTMQVGFIECEGAPLDPSGGHIEVRDAERTHSVWLTAQRPPDGTATAVYDQVWFSSEDIRPDHG